MTLKIHISVLAIVLLALLHNDISAQINTWDRPHNDRKISQSADGNFFHYGKYTQSWSKWADTVQKVAASGQILWQIGFPENIYLMELAPAADGGCYLVGQFWSNFNYGGFSNVDSLGGSMFLARCDNSGQMLWVKQANSRGGATPGDLVASSNGVILCGAIGGTTDLFGQTIVVSPTGSQLFVASFDANGNLLAINHGITTIATPNSEYISTSLASECGVDGAGNVYILVDSYGLSMMDTVPIGHWPVAPQDNDYNSFTSAILKLGANLKPKRYTELFTAPGVSMHYKDLITLQNGECYFNSYFYYAQGFNKMLGDIHKLDQSGNVAATFSLSQNKLFVSHMSKDSCENLYYTASGQDYNAPVTCNTLQVGRLSPNLASDWTYQFIDYNNFVIGAQVVSAGSNQCIISGIYDDTLKMVTHLIKNTNGIFFLAGIQGNGGTNCLQANVGITSLTPPSHGLVILPNPASNQITVRPSFPIQTINIYSVTGELLVSGNHENIDVNHLATGIYLLSVFGTEGQRETTRLVVNN